MHRAVNFFDPNQFKFGRPGDWWSNLLNNDKKELDAWETARKNDKLSLPRHDNCHNWLKQPTSLIDSVRMTWSCNIIRNEALANSNQAHLHG
jgi:hypothetical protein